MPQHRRLPCSARTEEEGTPFRKAHFSTYRFHYAPHYGNTDDVFNGSPPPHLIQGAAASCYWVEATGRLWPSRVHPSLSDTRGGPTAFPPSRSPSRPGCGDSECGELRRARDPPAGDAFSFSPARLPRDGDSRLHKGTSPAHPCGTACPRASPASSRPATASAHWARFAVAFLLSLSLPPVAPAAECRRGIARSAQRGPPAAAATAAPTRSIVASSRYGCIGKLNTSAAAASAAGRSPGRPPAPAKAFCRCSGIG